MSTQTLLRDLLSDQRLELHLLTTDRALLIAHLQTILPDIGPQTRAQIQMSIDMMKRPNMERIREMLNAPARQTREVGSVARALQGHSRAATRVEVPETPGMLEAACETQLDRALTMIFKP